MAPGRTRRLQPFWPFHRTWAFYVTDQLELKPRTTAWSLPYNVLYIDQPVGTGFSFTKNDAGYATNQEMVQMTSMRP